MPKTELISHNIDFAEPPPSHLRIGCLCSLANGYGPQGVLLTGCATWDMGDCVWYVYYEGTCPACSKTYWARRPLPRDGKHQPQR